MTKEKEFDNSHSESVTTSLYSGEVECNPGCSESPMLSELEWVAHTYCFEIEGRRVKSGNTGHVFRGVGATLPEGFLDLKRSEEFGMLGMYVAMLVCGFCCYATRMLDVNVKTLLLRHPVVGVG